MLTQNRQILVIAAIASRPYVEAAVKAGFDVIALDCFVDVDTKRLAKSMYQVPLQNGCLDSKYVLDIVKSIALQEVCGFCYGAGFEMQPAILGQINQYVEVIGNAEDVVMYCKDPHRFFEACDALEIKYPKVMFDIPKSAGQWLQKTIGSSGGAHIKRPLEKACEVLKGTYFQRHQKGKSISCLFLADTHNTQIIGFNEQWLDDNLMEPYRYGGAATQAKISGLARARLTSYVEKITQEIGLVGLNSCDAICDGDDVYMLEINPRLSATIGLYALEQPDLIAKHVKASQMVPLENLVDGNLDRVSTAHQILYAKENISIEDGFSWPTWVRDIPEVGNVFKVGMPVCTVLAEASTITQAKSMVRDRAIALNSEFLN